MNRLTPNHFSFQCPMNWNEMEPSANGRFCHQCRKEVFDLTNCSLDEVRALQHKHGSICGSIRVAHMAAVAISLSAAACKEKPPAGYTGVIVAPTSQPTEPESNTGDHGTPPAESPTRETHPPIVMGKIAPPPPEKETKPVEIPVIRGEIAPLPPAEPEQPTDRNP